MKVVNSGTTDSYDVTIASFYNTGGGLLATYTLRRTSDVLYLRVQGNGAASPATTVTTVSTGTLYHVWIKYLKVQTSGDAFASIAFSEDGVRPTGGNSYAATADGTSTTDAARLYLKASYTSATQGADVIFDHIRVDDATIGDNPS